MKKRKKILEEIYQRLFEHFGPQYWWPGDGDLEIIVGAVLTQNTSWKNVEKAVSNLKGAGVLELNSLYHLPLEKLEELVRPSGFYKIKAKRLKELIKFLYKSGSIDELKNRPLRELRNELLKVKGIGPETADSIILYALEKPVFVVDAYTKRILKRIGILEKEDVPYNKVQELFMENLTPDVKMYNEYHALFVRLGKEHCTKKAPKCGNCPLSDFCDFAKERKIENKTRY